MFRNSPSFRGSLVSSYIPRICRCRSLPVGQSFLLRTLCSYWCKRLRCTRRRNPRWPRRCKHLRSPAGRHRCRRRHSQKYHGIPLRKGITYIVNERKWKSLLLVTTQNNCFDIKTYLVTLRYWEFGNSLKKGIIAQKKTIAGPIQTGSVWLCVEYCPQCGSRSLHCVDLFCSRSITFKHNIHIIIQL